MFCPIVSVSPCCSVHPLKERSGRHEVSRNRNDNSPRRAGYLNLGHRGELELAFHRLGNPVYGFPPHSTGLSRVRFLRQMSISAPEYIARLSDSNLPASTKIHPSDGMFKPGREDHYRRVGQDAVRKIASILFAQGAEEPKRILDFGCGFGRVMRYMRAVFPESTLYAADTMRAAIDFCAVEFRSEPVASSREISKLRLPTDLDLIWAGSVATHLPEAETLSLISAFTSHLRPGGIAVFTTHGRCAASAFASGKWSYRLSEQAFRGAYTDFVNDRYGYVDYEDHTGYGFSLIPGSWLARQISRYADVCQIAFMERGWDNHQDVVAIRRVPAYRDGVASLRSPENS
jgi:SAM-dependent methyltransferase